MITIPKIELGDKVVQMRELTIGQALEVSGIPERMQEARLSKFLALALNDELLAESLTVQERYYLLMQYLSMQDGTPLAADVNFPAYLLPRNRPWKATVKGMICDWRQMTGHDAMLLELTCEGAADWVLASIAMQSVRSDWPVMPGPDAMPSERNEAMQARYRLVRDLPASEFEAMATEWRAACHGMARFIMTGFDNQGITVLPSSGGADDAPMRFRPSAAFGEVCRELERCLAEAGREAGEGLPDDDAGGD